MLRIAPETKPTKTFTHQRLCRKPGSTRFLQVLPAQDEGIVRCRLYEGSIDSTDFKALSYVWGSPDTIHRVFVNDKAFDVRENLFRFLQKAQVDYVNVPLWVDALCIDQNNIRERNWQVQQMTAIYEHAFEVLVWLQDVLKTPESLQYLENDAEARDRAEARRQVMCQLVDASTNRDVYSGKPFADVDHYPGDLEWYGPKVDSATALQGMSTPDYLHHAISLMIDIGKHEYWTRMWIVQEFSLARNITLVFSATTLSSNVLHGLCLALPLPLRDEDYGQGACTASNLLHFREVTISRKTTGGCRLEMPDLLYMYGFQSCTDIRDRIFALIGMSAQAQKFKIDYSMTKLQLYLSLFECIGFTSLISSGGFLKLLEVTVEEATEYVTSRQKHKKTFGAPFDGRLVKTRESGVERRFLHVCGCSHCEVLLESVIFTPQIFLVYLERRNTWLVYSSDPSKDNSLTFVACAGNMDVDDKLFVYRPSSPLGLALEQSYLNITQNEPLRIRLYTTEKGRVAYSFLTKIDLTTDELEAMIGHRHKMDITRLTFQPIGPFGYAYFDWDSTHL